MEAHKNMQLKEMTKAGSFCTFQRTTMTNAADKTSEMQCKNWSFDLARDHSEPWQEQLWQNSR